MLITARFAYDTLQQKPNNRIVSNNRIVGFSVPKDTVVVGLSVFWLRKINRTVSLTPTPSLTKSKYRWAPLCSDGVI